MATAEIARKYDTMADALADYAREDRIGAEGYCAEGYELAEAAFDMPAEDRDDFIDAQSYAFPAGTRYLVGVSADYRLAELAASEVALRVAA